MKRIFLTLSCLLAASTVTGLDSHADAAEPYPSYSNGPLPRAVAAGGGGYYDGFEGGATSYEESVMNGQAAMMRAYGDWALNTAEALRSYEEAVDKALDNKVKRLEVRQERQRMGRTHQAEVQRIRLARQADAREAQQAREEVEAAMSSAEKTAERERLASGKLELARRLQQHGKFAAAQRWMREIVEEYPGTACAREISPLIVGQ